MKTKVLMMWMGNKKGILGGVGYYRMALPARYMKKHDVEVISGDDVDKYAAGQFPDPTLDKFYGLLTSCDILWMKHSDNLDAAGPLFNLANHLNVPIILDFDDNYFALPPHHHAYEDHKPGSEKRAVVAATLSMATAITVSTEPLKEAYKKLLKDVYKLEKDIIVLPNMNDAKEFKKVPQLKKDKGDIIIGYHGSITHNEDLKSIVPALEEVLSKYKNVKVEIMGALSSDDAVSVFENMDDELLDRVHVIAGTQGWEGFPERLMSLPWDIGIAPLIDDEFNRSKSHIKWMEYAMKKIPTVASPVYPYQVIEHGKTGFLAKTKDEWVDILSKLIEDKQLRKEIGENAHDEVLLNWQMKDGAYKWDEVIDKYTPWE